MISAGGARRSWARATGAAGLLALAAGLLAGCTSAASPASGGSSTTSPGRGGTLTVAEADAIVRSVMATNNRANAHLDTRLLGSYEAGSAYTIDAAQYQASRLAHASNNVPFSVVPLETVLAPGSATSPERFVVVGKTVLLKKLPKSQLGSCPSNDTLLVFQRSAGGRWQIVLEPSASTGAFARFATTAGHVASPVPSSLASTAGGVPGRVARALVRYEASGALGPFRRSDFSGSCWAVPDPRAAVQGALQAGFDARELFSPSGAALTYPLEGGRALELFTLRFADTIVAGSGTSIYWRHDSTIPSSALLPVGHYSRVTESGAVEIAAFVSPSGSYQLCGAYSGTTSITGVRAKVSSGGTGPTLLGFVRR